jgi:hypothetical protein
VDILRNNLYQTKYAQSHYPQTGNNDQWNLFFSV